MLVCDSDCELTLKQVPSYKQNFHDILVQLLFMQNVHRDLGIIVYGSTTLYISSGTARMIKGPEQPSGKVELFAHPSSFTRVSTWFTWVKPHMNIEEVKEKTFCIRIFILQPFEKIQLVICLQNNAIFGMSKSKKLTCFMFYFLFLCFIF